MTIAMTRATDDAQRDRYRTSFNKEALCDIAARRDVTISRLVARLHEVEQHTKSLAMCDEFACGSRP